MTPMAVSRSSSPLSFGRMGMGIRRLAMILGHTSGSTVMCRTPGDYPGLSSNSELKQLSSWTAATRWKLLSCIFTRCICSLVCKHRLGCQSSLSLKTMNSTSCGVSVLELLSSIRHLPSGFIIVLFHIVRRPLYGTTSLAHLTGNILTVAPVSICNTSCFPFTNIRHFAYAPRFRGVSDPGVATVVVLISPIVVRYVVHTSLVLVSRQLICVAPFHAFPMHDPWPHNYCRYFHMWGAFLYWEHNACRNIDTHASVIYDVYRFTYIIQY